MHTQCQWSIPHFDWVHPHLPGLGDGSVLSFNGVNGLRREETKPHFGYSGHLGPQSSLQCIIYLEDLVTGSVSMMAILPSRLRLSGGANKECSVARA